MVEIRWCHQGMEYGGDTDDDKNLQFGMKVVINIFIYYNGRKKLTMPKA
jgi:hypothetical protein